MFYGRQYGGTCSGCGSHASPEVMAAVQRASGALARTPNRLPYVMVGEKAPMCADCRRTPSAGTKRPGGWYAVQRAAVLMPLPAGASPTVIAGDTPSKRRSRFELPTGAAAANKRIAHAAALAG